jgi:hypothetical protein
MPKLDLTNAEFETMLYALGVAEADLAESVADASQSAEDRAEWTVALAETRALLAKCEPMAADVAA